MKPIATTDTAQGDLLNALEDALYRGQIGRRSFILGAMAAGASLASAQVMAQDGTDAAGGTQDVREPVT